MAADEVDAEPTKDGVLTFKLDNQAPVALDDLTVSLHTLAQSFEDYLSASGLVRPEDSIKLYIHELRTGTIVALLQAIAKQGRFLFGEHGVVSTVKAVYERADTIAPFLISLNDAIQFFLGNQEGKKEPSKKEADQIVKILEPVAKDNGSQVFFDFKGPAHIGQMHFHYNSQEANAVQNNARRYLGPTLPTNQILRDELLTLHQVRGDSKSRTGDKGIIESISKLPVKLMFSSEEIKKGILDSPDNPFQRVFVVDVEVKTVGDEPALYKVLALKDNFEMP